MPLATCSGASWWAQRHQPQVAARLARALNQAGRNWPSPTAAPPAEAIARVAARTDLSNDVREVVTRALAD